MFLFCAQAYSTIPFIDSIKSLNMAIQGWSRGFHHSNVKLTLRPAPAWGGVVCLMVKRFERL